jgi:hypothetical protein
MLLVIAAQCGEAERVYRWRGILTNAIFAPPPGFFRMAAGTKKPFIFNSVRVF